MSDMTTDLTPPSTASLQSIPSLRLEQHLTILESLPDATVIIDSQGKIVFVNNQAEVLFGYHRDEMLGELVEMLLPHRSRDSHVGQRDRFMVIPHVRPMGRGLDLYGMRKDGIEFPIETHLGPIQTADGLLVLSAIRDISDRKAAEAKIQRLNEELARSNVELDQFAAIAAHDLQEPLRMISSYTTLLQMRLDDKLDGKCREFMGTVIKGTKRMSDLIRAILDYSKVGHHGIKSELVDSTAAACTAVKNLESQIASVNGSVVIDGLPAIVADPVLIVQLLQNLVNNGIKFRSKDRAPAITIAARETEHEWVFSVADNGIGIRAEDTARIFALFQRVHAAAEYPGAGIGLATCTRIAERHGGRLWVESTVDVGTTFFFSFPKP